MREQLFYDAIQLLSEHEMPLIRETKRGLMLIGSTLGHEKMIGSVNVLKTIHHRDSSSKSKKTRIKYIDEKLIPSHIDILKFQIVDNFVEVKNGSILRIRDLINEKTRLTKLTSEHDLKTKSMLRTLANVFEEERKLFEFIEIVEASEILYNFFTSRKIVYYNLNEVGKRKLYNEYMSGR